MNEQKTLTLGRDLEIALGKLVNLNKAGAEAAGQKADNEYSTAFRTVLALLAVAVLGGFCAAFYLVRDVSGGIASIVSPMKALGRGRPHRHRAASGREDRNRNHGRHLAGVQGRADRQEGGG